MRGKTKKRREKKKKKKRKEKKGFYFIILIIKGFLSAFIVKVLCTGSFMICGLLAGFLVLQGAGCGCQVSGNLGKRGGAVGQIVHKKCGK
jgi:hypothetical protein